LLALCLVALLSLGACDQSDVTQEGVMKKIYDTLFYAYTGSGGAGAVLPGLPPGRGADQTFLSIATPGLPVDAATYANSWSPSNPTGSTEAAEAFSMLVDVIPSLSVPYISMGSLEERYGYLVTGQEVSSTNITDAQKAQFDKAMSVLTKNGTDYDINGKPVTVQMDSDFYGNYKRKRQSYSDAISAYLMAYFQYNMSDPKDQREWSLIGPLKYTPVKDAYNDYQRAQPGVIEEALATVSQFQSSSVTQALSRAKGDFESTKRASVLDPARTYHVSYATPANWFSKSSGSWASASVSFKEETQDSKSHYSSFSGGGGFGYGLWRLGGNFGSTHTDNQTHASTENLSVSFDFLRCEVQRPWLKESLFSLLGYRVAGIPQHGFSTGDIAPTNKGTAPLIAKSLVLVQNVKISADWSQTDTSTITNSMTSSGSVGWGPFSVSASYSSGSGESHFKSTFDGRTLTIPDPQIVGVISSVVPPSPPEP